MQEFNEFKDKRKELLEKRMNQLYEGTDDENILKTGKKKFDNMTPSEKETALTNLKTSVTKEAKQELFGKQRMSRDERILYKKLVRAKKMN